MATMRPIKAIFIGCVVILMTFCAGIAVWLFQEKEYSRITSTDGRYAAIVTYRRYQSMIPRLPGQGSDMEGFVVIKDTSGVQYGKVPIALVWMARDIRWDNDGATIPGAVTWKFSTRECASWD